MPELLPLSSVDLEEPGDSGTIYSESAKEKYVEKKNLHGILNKSAFQ